MMQTTPWIGRSKSANESPKLMLFTTAVALGTIVLACACVRLLQPSGEIVEIFDPVNPSLTDLLPESESQMAHYTGARIATDMPQTNLQQLAKLVGRIKGIRHEILAVSPIKENPSNFEVKVPNHFICVEWNNGQWRLVHVANYLEVSDSPNLLE